MSESKYLFTATFRDGSRYTQNAHDTSATNKSKSCFYDVAKRGLEQVSRFELSGSGHTYAVSLLDGHFEVDGVSFRFHELLPANLRLIFFRRHTHTFGGGQELSHSMVYRFGWQGTDKDGRNVQRVMEID